MSDSKDHLRGAIAATITPFRAGGDEVDLAAIAPLTEHLAEGGIDGVLAMGTTGEGILLDTDERKAVAQAFVDAGRGRMTVMVHCGAQTTSATARLAAHAAETSTKLDLDRTLTCRIPDLDTAFHGRLVDGRIIDLTDGDDPTAKLKLTANSDDLVAMVDGDLNLASAWASGRIKINASFLDLLKLRKLM